MKLAARGYRVAVVGASSLLGKELVGVLEERNFSIARLVSFEDQEEEPDLPIVDWRENLQTSVADQEVREQDLDFAFLAGPVRSASSLPSFLRSAVDGGGSSPPLHEKSAQPAAGGSPVPPARERREGCCSIIDLTETLAGWPSRVLTIPFLEARSLPVSAGRPSDAQGALAGRPERTVKPRGESVARVFSSPLSSAILISTILLRLAARFRVERAVAHVYEPASAIGPRAIEELQKQTVSLLSFQKIPKSVFGAQLAFNLLPRLPGSGGGLKEIEATLRRQLRDYLAERAPMPAVCLFQVPVFYSLGLSLYFETSEGVSPATIAQALAGAPVRVRQPSQPAPSQVEAAGSNEILMDAICQEPDRSRAFWVWAVADNLRLTALNAVEIAERAAKQVELAEG